MKSCLEQLEHFHPRLVTWPCVRKFMYAQSRPQVTVTPIKHLVIIFPENISFDHYFGTYPHAKNPPGDLQRIYWVAAHSRGRTG